jgi:hypothetical protein
MYYMTFQQDLREYLFCILTDETTECDAIFGAFQLKLIELRQEMERKGKLLVEKENIAKQAWLVYRAAA